MSEDLRFTASSAHVWMACAAYPRVTANVARDPNTEGIAAHMCATRALRGLPPEPTYTDEMIECATMYVEAVRSSVPDYDHSSIETEEAVGLEFLGMRDGRLDASYCDGKTLTVWDYKFGHRRVHAYQNYQLLAYALGKHRAGWTFDSVTLVVVQPRCFDGYGPVSEWTIPVSELLTYSNRFTLAVAASTSKGAETHSGSHCLYCETRHMCSAAKNSAGSAIDYVMLHGVARMTDDALAAELKLLTRGYEAVKLSLEAAQAEATARITQGQTVPGWCIETGTGNRAWTAPPSDIAILGDMIGIDMRKPDVISPTAAIASLKKRGLDESVISSYIKRANTSPRLKPVDTQSTMKLFGAK